MSTTSKPRHGDAIVELQERFGVKVGVPTRQFQTFLDELDVTAQELSDILDSLNMGNTPSILARVVQLQKDIADIKQPNLLPMIQRLLKEEIPQHRAPSLSLVDKRLTELEQRHPRSFLSEINQLNKITDEQAQLIGSLRSQNGRLYSFVNTLLVGAQNIIEVDSARKLLPTADIANCDGTFTLTIPDIGKAVKEITITSTNGAIALAADATIQTPTSVSNLTSVTIYPARGQWWHK